MKTKAIIVSSSTLAKHGRWDAGYYLGAGESDFAAVNQANENLKKAETRLQNAKERVAKAQQRHQKFIASGEVKPI